MNKIAVMVLALAACAASVQAQVYKWVDKDGKVQYSDQPPPPDAAKSALQKVISTSSSAPAAQSDKAAEKAPDKGKEFEKRRSESAEKQKKADEASKLAGQKQESCDSARAHLKNLEVGGRISKIDANGERYFLDDDQFQQEIAQAQDVIAESCK
jgi:hypothetical protein